MFHHVIEVSDFLFADVVDVFLFVEIEVYVHFFEKLGVQFEFYLRIPEAVSDFFLYCFF